MSNTAPVVAPAELSNAVVAPVAPEVTTPKVKKAKAPKASPPVVKSKGTKGSTIAYEPGIATLTISDIDATPSMNLTRPEWAESDKAELKELAEQIASVGQQSPIVVQRVKGSAHPYRLAAGYRRLAAISSLKRDTIEARVEASGTDEARVLVNITENENARQATSALGKLAAVEALAALGHNPSEAAALMGHAEDFIRDLMRIPKCHPELREALAGDLSFSVGRLVARCATAAQPLALRLVRPLSVEATRSALATLRVALAAKAQTADGDYRPALDVNTVTARYDRLRMDDVEAAQAYLVRAIAAAALLEHEGAEGDEGEGEGDEKGSSKASKGEDALYPEARVIKATVPFLVKYVEAQDAMDKALVEMLKATEALDAAWIATAAKAMSKAQGLVVKAFNAQNTALTGLFGEKMFNAAFKAAKKAAQE